MSEERANFRCTHCEYRPTEAEAKAGIRACPQCGTESLPMADADDVEIKINWHELRILGIWAENYAVAIEEKAPGSQRLVNIIAGRIHAQFPERTALTMSGELAEMRQYAKEHGWGEVETTYPEDPEANAR